MVKTLQNICNFCFHNLLIIKKAIHVTGLGGPYGYETSRIPHFLDNRLTEDDEVVSHTRQPPFTPHEDSWYSFLLEAESTQGHNAARRTRSIDKIHLVGDRTRDLPACSIVPLNLFIE
jgi:hypothetical protein